jgi:predicted nucleotidyltransferase
MESRVIPPDHASMRQTEMGEKFNRVLFKALDAMEARGIPYGLIGGIAVSGMGRPRSTHDIDIFVRPEDADASLEALAAAGFETDKTYKSWLYKGWMEEMMVDIIFKSSGDLYFDDEMQQHAKPIKYHGRSIPAVSPEDLIIIKGVVHSEIGPHHWHDALAILSHAQIDWDYLLKRARRAQRRILALLIYAQSNDVYIPNNIIVKMAQNVYSDSLNVQQGIDAKLAASQARPSRWPAQVTQVEERKSSTPGDIYLLAHVHEALAADPRCGAIDVELNVGGNRIAVKGEAQSRDHRQAIEDVVRECAKGFFIDNQVRVSEVSAPVGEEVL